MSSERLIQATITRAQATAIAAQTMVYFQPQTPCEGLADAPSILLASDWKDRYDAELEPGEVGVDFHYMAPDGHVGLETTVFGPDGTVTYSQDWG